MKKRYENWMEKLSKKEIAIVEKAEEKAKERKVNLMDDLRRIHFSIENKGITLKSLEGSKVTISNCVLSDFPHAYKYIPYGTVTTYAIKGGRPHIEKVVRDNTTDRIMWNFTEEAKKAIIEKAIHF